jgi:acid phosphatase (class A)
MKRFGIAGLVACCLGSFAHQAMAKEANFATPAQSGSDLILPSPPAPGSAIETRELEELHALETSRTEQQSAQAAWDDKNETIFLFHTLFGDGFNAEKLPAVAAFGKHVHSDEGVNTDTPKKIFHRPRPYNADKTLHPICATKTKDDSYPSGHATSGYLLALSMLDLVPEKRDAIFARADEFAFDRLICGVHYRSDIEASKSLAYAIHAVMRQSPKYQAEMTAARAELRRSLDLQP